MKQTRAKPDRDLSAEKTEAILAGAMQEFLVHGYAGTSMDRVAAAAQVSKATVYSHFQDKESLFTALIQQMARQKELFAIHKLHGPDDDPKDTLRRFAREMMARAVSDPQMVTFFRLMIGESGRFPELARLFIEHMEKPAFETFTQFFAATPDRRHPDPQVCAHVFMGALVHFLMTREVMHGRDLLGLDADQLIEGLMQLIFV